MVIKTVLIIIIVAIIFLFHLRRIRDLTSNRYWKNKNKKILTQCRLRLKEVYDFIPTPNKFLHAGTLLGCVREQDIIPFDDDIDIVIYVDKDNEINKLKKSICRIATKKNYQCKDIWFGLKLIKKDKYQVGVDIFFYKLDKDNKFISPSLKARLLWPDEYYEYNELKIIAKGNILDNVYNICSNSENVLSRFYGKDWRNKYITHTHQFDLNNFRLRNLTLPNIMDIYLITLLRLFKLNKVT